MTDRVVLVNEQDLAIGSAGKLKAHEAGLLHRALSVFIVDHSGRMLLQRRAGAKYHSGGLWSNACCSHPRPGEPVEEAARRRLMEEMGIDCPLDHKGFFIYRAELDGGLVEHELDHLFVGRWEGTPVPDPVEVSDWRWAEPSALAIELAETPDRFTRWFGLALNEIRQTRLSS